jgi:hypothetical protein
VFWVAIPNGNGNAPGQCVHALKAFNGGNHETSIDNLHLWRLRYLIGVVAALGFARN